MSAWLVSKAHIDVLVHALIADGVVPARECNAVGRLLWAENRASLYARYGDEIDWEANDAYVFKSAPSALDDAKVAAAIGCYYYQSCESGDRGFSGLPWEQTLAHRLMMELVEIIAVRNHVSPPTLETLRIWTEAVAQEREGEEVAVRNGWWGIHRIEDALA